MSFVTRQAAHCDQCSHEWLVVGASTPKHCAKCKSRRWNSSGAIGVKNVVTGKEDLRMLRRVQPDMQDLREICAGKVAGVGVLERMEHVPTTTVSAEIPICGKRWWEDGTQYECLMDKGHREQKHGLRGMVQRLED